MDDGEVSYPKRKSSALSEPVNAKDEVSFGYSNAGKRWLPLNSAWDINGLKFLHPGSLTPY